MDFFMIGVCQGFSNYEFHDKIFRKLFKSFPMNLTETVEENQMRTDYSIYIVALICFIIAGVFFSYASQLDLGIVAGSIFLILGILFAIGGYSLRPKVAVPAPKTPPTLPVEPSSISMPPPVEEKAEVAPVAPQPPTEEQVPSVSPTPSPAEEAPPSVPTLEEPAKVEEEKPVRRRRRKKTA